MFCIPIDVFQRIKLLVYMEFEFPLPPTPP